MIQRIQSVFLLLAAAAGFGQFAIPYLSTTSGDPASSLPALSDQVLNPMDNPGLLGLCALSGIVSLIAIFMFRNRPLQARLGGGAAVASLLLTVLVVFVVFQIRQQMPEGGNAQYGAGLALPVAGMIFDWLAVRFIRKDETLVRSMDRLR
ncbi:MAG: DUF4293 domain-containing protein [Saprospiraceae bacterium]|nr:DUF4293 domain-containing protein [Saprospiraceae bacterium]MCB0545401.1 DUF4293 domain-containing protein [Saprospiraceae bacterium]MCB0576384.1 DUF4293 domain-containing protein [Saprospiraceae bacterium]MCB9305076.1 DUF4293 domain-containing protein [Lewinellaceae bacterium]MCB9353354.1 DUF4293 domain-containing protein [Lewinellaceae bacterium]